MEQRNMSLKLNLTMFENSLDGLISLSTEDDDSIVYHGNRDDFLEFKNKNTYSKNGVVLLISKNKIQIVLNHFLDKEQFELQWWKEFYFLTNKNYELGINECLFIENYLNDLVNIDNYTYDKMTFSLDSNVKNKIKAKADLYLLLLEILKVKFFKYRRIKKHQLNTYLSDKKAIIEYLVINHGFSDMNTTNTTMASLNKTGKIYWANPNMRVLNSRWYLILNNKKDRIFFVFDFPKNILRKTNIRKNGYIKVRNDSSKVNALDIQIRANDFMEISSKIDFKKFLIKVINY